MTRMWSARTPTTASSPLTVYRYPFAVRHLPFTVHPFLPAGFLAGPTLAAVMEEKHSYYGDLEKTAILQDLFDVPADRRDEAWQASLFANIADASFACGEPQVITGPDGFPYFQLNIPEPGKPFECFVIRHMIGEFLLQNGWGVVIHAHKPQPDWVFIHGDMVNYHLRGEFYSTPEAQVESVAGGQEVLLAQPSEQFLPALTRGVMRSYLAHYGARDPKVLLTSRQAAGGVFQELLFSVTPEHFPDGTDYDAVMRNLGWFMPRGYRYSAARDEGFGNAFQPL